jgi:microcin C transport system substrate-binding protein
VTAADRFAVSRRQVLAGAGAFLAAGNRPARAAGAPQHGFSTFGDLKYGADFTCFDYVNPDAPKGGRLVTIASTTFGNQNFNTFNTLNSYILKGDAAPGLQRIFASLMVRAEDEPDAVYGLIAESVTISADGNRYAFTLRKSATFHDGSPITSADVAFSYEALKTQGHPDFTEVLHELDRVETPTPDVAVLVFSGRQSRGAAGLAVTFPVFSKAYYATTPFEQTTLQSPLGNGPYKVGRFSSGSFIEYNRVADWWGANLPVMKGQMNFDVLRYEFYKERTVAFEAFKAGQYLVHEEFSSLNWATQYDFPAVRAGHVVRREIEDRSPSGAQGWHINLRREKFKDIRVREAIGLAFDFEWSNRNLFYGSYRRTQSAFVNTEFEAIGKPSADELVLLEPFRGQVSDAVFGMPVMQPVSDGSGRDRTLLRRAAELLAEAGWRVSDGILRNRAGEALRISFLDNSQAFARILAPFITNLRHLGIEATHEIVDASQYQKRRDEFDFDMVSLRQSLQPTPDESIRVYWHSSQAGIPGSTNLAGLADPVVDALLEKALKARSRDELTITCRALDRVLRTARYWIPQWSKASHWIAMWDIYQSPALKPRYDRGIESTWWLDADKARHLEKGL